MASTRACNSSSNCTDTIGSANADVNKVLMSKEYKAHWARFASNETWFGFSPMLFKRLFGRRPRVVGVFSVYTQKLIAVLHTSEEIRLTNGNEHVQETNYGPFPNTFQGSLHLCAGRIGLPRYQLLLPVSANRTERQKRQIELPSFTFFMKSLLILSVWTHVRVPDLHSIHRDEPWFSSKGWSRTNARKRETYWKFVSSSTLENFLSPRLKQKLTARQKRVKTRAPLPLLSARNRLANHVKIMSQTCKTKSYRAPRPRWSIMSTGRIRHISFKKSLFHYFGCPEPERRSLPANRRIRLEWTLGTMKWPTDTEHLRKCHPREIRLAAQLGLSGQQYVDSKARIIYARIWRGRFGQGFQKIDAQRACRIHYKKSGSLYKALKSMGWFKRAYYFRPAL